MIIEKVARRTFDLFFNSYFVDFLVHINNKYIAPKFRKANGRYYTKIIKNAGKDFRIKGTVTIHYPENLIVQDYVRIGEGSFLFCKGGIHIGNNSQISRNVLVYSANHDINAQTIPYDDTYIEKRVKIGNSVWIGMNVVITPGVTIGDGAIIGMGTVISKDVPDGAIVVGAQQRVVGYRDMEDYYINDNKQNWFAKIWPNL